MGGGQPGSLLLHPVLECRRVAQIETVEEGATVERDRLGQRAGRKRLIELSDVAADGFRVKPHRVSAEKELAVYLPPQVVQQLLQPVPRGIDRTLGPEMRHEGLGLRLIGIGLEHLARLAQGMHHRRGNPGANHDREMSRTCLAGPLPRQ